jgi:hypothetical protein
LGLTGISIVIFGTSKYGIGVQPDSVAYISTARNLVNGKGFILYNGQFYVHWPPLFPIILAIISFFNIDPLNSVRIVNAIVFGLIIFFSGYLFLSYFKSKLFAFIGILAILLSPQLLKVSGMALSEPVYILLSILFCLIFPTCLTKKGIPPFIFSILIASLACLQRTLGITLILTGTFLFFLNNQLSIRTRITYATTFFSLSVLPALLWIVRNYIFTGTFTGVRAPAYYGFLKNSLLTFETLARWFVPPYWYYFIGQISFATIIVFVAVWYLIIFRRKKNYPTDYKIFQLKCIISYIVIYLLVLITSSSLTANEIISEGRLLTPLYPFIIFLVFYRLDNCYKQITFTSVRKRGIILTVGCLLCLWLLYPASKMIDVLSEWREDGIGKNYFDQAYYSKTAWQESPSVKWLKKHSLRGDLYSNEPTALYILTGLVADFAHKRKLSSQSSSHNTCTDCFLIWFKDNLNNQTRFLFHRNRISPLEKLKTVKMLEAVRTFSDGTIYRCK